MKVKYPVSLFLLILFTLLFSAVSFAQDKSPQRPFTPEELMKMDRGTRRPPEGVNFEVIFAEGTQALYTVVLHGVDRGFVQGLFHISQLESMEAIISEAKKFGLTEEAVGGAKPITTRFSDPQLPNFFVDVSKINLQTRFYVTLKGSGGTLTIDAGSIRRGEKKKKDDEAVEPILFDQLIDRIHAAKQPSQSGM